MPESRVLRILAVTAITIHLTSASWEFDTICEYRVSPLKRAFCAGTLRLYSVHFSRSKERTRTYEQIIALLSLIDEMHSSHGRPFITTVWRTGRYIIIELMDRAAPLYCQVASRHDLMTKSTIACQFRLVFLPCPVHSCRGVRFPRGRA